MKQIKGKIANDPLPIRYIFPVLLALEAIVSQDKKLYCGN